jgi:hypothetical protein
MSRLVRKAKSMRGSSAEREVAVFRVATTLLLGVALTGCGTSSDALSNSGPGHVVARVGNATIDRAEVDHWASAIERGKAIGTVLGPTSGTPRERALEFLISSSWITGEARARELSISNTAVERRLQEKIRDAPNGRSEFNEELVSTGQTLADVKLEIKDSLASASLRNAATQHVPAVTDAEVGSYYSHHRQRFYLPDRRLVDLVEHIPGYGQAVALGKQLGPGARFAKRAIRELVRRETPAEAARFPNGQLVHTIFAATPGRVAGPARYNGQWVLAVVRKLIPSAIQPLGVVRGELSKTLAADRRKQSLKRFAATYVRRWTANTSCSPGYVVQQCSEYRGAPARGTR